MSVSIQDPSRSSGSYHSATKARLGFWAPVYGNWIISKQPDTLDASFDSTRKLTLLAEDIGFVTTLFAEHTFHPFDGEFDQLETWTSIAGLALLTKHIELLAVRRPAFKHPVIVAKMASNIDQISKGRMAINLVSGWWQRECTAMGLPAISHAERYQRSEEFLTIVKGLWTQPYFRRSRERSVALPGLHRNIFSCKRNPL